MYRNRFEKIFNGKHQKKVTGLAPVTKRYENTNNFTNSKDLSLGLERKLVKKRK